MVFIAGKDGQLCHKNTVSCFAMPPLQTNNSLRSLARQVHLESALDVCATLAGIAVQAGGRKYHMECRCFLDVCFAEKTRKERERGGKEEGEAVVSQQHPLESHILIDRRAIGGSCHWPWHWRRHLFRREQGASAFVIKPINICKKKLGCQHKAKVVLGSRAVRGHW